MQHEDNDLLHLNPVNSYKAPHLPKLEDARTDSALLKNLPLRWKKNAAIVACIGLTGTLSLSSCANIGRPHHGGSGGAPIYVTGLTEQETVPFAAMPANETELELKVHHGGSGGAPTYIVHLTEQEALGMIRAQLEAAGLCFGDPPPSVFFEYGHGSIGNGDVAFDLYDREKDVVVKYLSWDDSNQPFSYRGSQLAEWAEEELKQRMDKTNVGVFYNPGEVVGWGEVEWLDPSAKDPTDEDKIAAIPTLRENLSDQAQEFIDYLQKEGIL